MCRLVCAPVGSAGRRRGRGGTTPQLNAPTPARVTGPDSGRALRGRSPRRGTGPEAGRGNRREPPYDGRRALTARSPRCGGIRGAGPSGTVVRAAG
ncbi:hypothetical protein GCM10010215_29530 [Streptomyces virginiae]|uniref:Uncharacterized protein n=1 Tax=Streptomyces virginiae TaxID=1961 RepID=A0ABQ3NG35_STRVG|nr:hypothetical protein GCM10010215_29530 [Streptomyces virginiae]GHI11674.1 hypothetical protein Scinn_11370 [Streptomyces virginiae]GLV93665.1 hypothetical protein Slala04_51190 [Streptomyces lavendulae subsp. lavendulae]